MHDLNKERLAMILEGDYAGTITKDGSKLVIEIPSTPQITDRIYQKLLVPNDYVEQLKYLLEDAT